MQSTTILLAQSNKLYGITQLINNNSKDPDSIKMKHFYTFISDNLVFVRAFESFQTNYLMCASLKLNLRSILQFIQ